MFSRIGSAAYKADISNTIYFCGLLGNPHKKFKSIHIAGTNGKGSVSHMLAAVFQNCGYKTGLYTSPHLYDFRERIKINGEMVDEQFVVDFVANWKEEIEKVRPSFFEITVAMAFDFFAKQEIDIAIIETGLGGRLDSTNIIEPELSIITNIGWDHSNMLGDTLEKIAFEKAGIIKTNTPVVIGERQTATEKVFIDVAAEKNANLLFASDNISVSHYSWDNNLLTAKIMNNGKDEKWQLDLIGIYQLKNLATVLASLEVLKGDWKLNDYNLQFALSHVKKLTGLKGRWDVINTNPTVILEVAHNKDGIAQMLQHIKQLNFNKLHLVFGMVKDKDIEVVLSMLPANAFYYFTSAQIPRALPVEELMVQAKKSDLKGNYFEDVNQALEKAISIADENDLIIVFGSIFLVAEVKPFQ